jgi:hypothetical protein
MRPRVALLAPALAVTAALAAPAVAGAAPVNHLTINTTINPITAGDAVVLYGHLSGPNHAHQTIVLYRRMPLFGPPEFAGTTATDRAGYYEFTRPVDSVATNRSWYAVAPNLGVRSRAVRERVYATVSLTASETSSETNQVVVFAGHVFPPLYHLGDRVVLQEQEGLTGDSWHTLKSGFINLGSNFAISYRFRTPGAYDLRVLLHGDIYNIVSQSPPISVTVQQKERAAFTILTSSPVIVDSQSAMISGILYAPPTSATASPVPDPSVPVTLWARPAGATRFEPIAHGMTASDGSYDFTVSPPQNTAYQVSTTFAPPALRRTAVLWEAVRSLVSIIPSTSTALVDEPVTLTGTVTPDEAGHFVYLERLGKDGNFHTVAVSFISAASAYQFKWTPGTADTFTLRTVVPGDRLNATGTSTPVTVTAALPPVPQLPTSS